jgi:hypothetical protein
MPCQGLATDFAPELADDVELLRAANVHLPFPENPRNTLSSFQLGAGSK